MLWIWLWICMAEGRENRRQTEAKAVTEVPMPK